MTICSRAACSLALSAFLLAAAPAARAQGEGQDQAAARSLFDEGRKLMKANDFANACPKLEAASHLYASAGILLNLADCHEKLGQTASAWTEFGDAAAAATRAHRPDQATEAKHRQDALEPKLVRLQVRVAHEVPGLVVHRDDLEVASAAWGSAIAIDPGPHVLRAEAPGYLAWTTTVNVATPGQTTAVDIPVLQAAPVAATPPTGAAAGVSLASNDASSGPPGDVGPPKGRSALPGIVLIAGGAAVGIGGAVLMVIESGRAKNARDSNTSAATTQASADAYNSTKTPWAIGLVGAIAGGVAAGAGAILLVSSHSAKTPATGLLQATPWVAPGSGGVAVAGAW